MGEQAIYLNATLERNSLINIVQNMDDIPLNGGKLSIKSNSEAMKDFVELYDEFWLTLEKYFELLIDDVNCAHQALDQLLLVDEISAGNISNLGK